jgi:hypothetical protein
MNLTQLPPFELEKQQAVNRQRIKRPQVVDSHERDRNFLSDTKAGVLQGAAKKCRAI